MRVLGQGDIPPKLIGERIREARKHEMLTMREAAEGLGISLSTYAQLESGRRSPSFSRVLTIARILGLDPRILAPEFFMLRFRPKSRTSMERRRAVREREERKAAQAARRERREAERDREN